MANPNNIDLSGDELFHLMTGICHCVVCAPAHWTAEQVEDVANRQSPTGISSRWSVADPSPTENGEGLHNTSTLPCPDEPGRTHWHLSC